MSNNVQTTVDFIVNFEIMILCVKYILLHYEMINYYPIEMCWKSLNYTDKKVV